mmetsp:Transcript_7700/g.19012  ORF Transcript_7700/g.19012 Transcript_7700/m.19012 type:complete len:127 (-) Transcript_7700:896-1276(-)
MEECVYLGRQAPSSGCLHTNWNRSALPSESLRKTFRFFAATKHYLVRCSSSLVHCPFGSMLQLPTSAGIGVLDRATSNGTGRCSSMIDVSEDEGACSEVMVLAGAADWLEGKAVEQGQVEKVATSP